MEQRSRLSHPRRSHQPASTVPPRRARVRKDRGKVAERGKCRGFTPDPTKRLCLLDLRQGQWPLEPFILVGEWERADGGVEMLQLALSHSPTNGRIAKAIAFAGGPGGNASWWVQGRSPCASSFSDCRVTVQPGHRTEPPC